MSPAVIPTAIGDPETGLYVPAVRVVGEKSRVPVCATAVRDLKLAVDLARDRIATIWPQLELVE